ncbi:hypothetical protein QEN19_003104 [Hanseniaspora menglaensis]
MAESNILSLMSQKPPSSSEKVEYEDCIPCQVMATVFALSLGTYFQTQHPFPKTKSVNNKEVILTASEWNHLYPKWYRQSMKVTGWALIGFGIYRGTENWLWFKHGVAKQKME